MATSTTTAQQKRSGSMQKWMQGLLCGAALAWMPGYVLIIGVMLLPALAVYVMDSKRGEASARMMMPYTFAALVHPLHQVWDADGSMEAAINVLMNPVHSVLGWSAAGGGWFVLELSLFGVKLVRQFNARKRKLAIEKRLKSLSDEWDEKPDGAPEGVVIAEAEAAPAT